MWGVRKLGALHDKDRSEGSRTALHTAAYYGSSDAVHLLIHAGVDTNATDSTFSRTTPLMESARAGHAGKYIASFSNPDPNPPPSTPKARLPCPEVTSRAYRKNTCVRVSCPHPLIPLPHPLPFSPRSLISPHPGICRTLITHGKADASRVDFQGNTALHWAARRGHSMAVVEIVTSVQERAAQGPHAHSKSHASATPSVHLVERNPLVSGFNPETKEAKARRRRATEALFSLLSQPNAKQKTPVDVATATGTKTAIRDLVHGVYGSGGDNGGDGSGAGDDLFVSHIAGADSVVASIDEGGGGGGGGAGSLKKSRGRGGVTRAAGSSVTNAKLPLDKEPTTPGFPPPMSRGHSLDPEERVQLLDWLKDVLKKRRIGSARLLSLMDDNRSNCASFNEFSFGLQMVDIDLYRAEYQRLFKAVDAGGDRSVTVVELKAMLYGEGGDGGASSCSRVLNPTNRASFGTCKSCKKENADLSHNSWRAGPPAGSAASLSAAYGGLNDHDDDADLGPKHPLYTPVMKWFGWCHPCYARETVVVEVKRRTTPDDFPALREKSGATEDAERIQLLAWLRAELEQRRVSSARLLPFMDTQRMACASFMGFSHGLQMVDIDLERPDYMRLFMAVDVGGDRSVTMGEMKDALYGPLVSAADQDKRAMTPANRGSYGTCKTCKKENIDLSHNSWTTEEVLYTPVLRYFGWCAKCFKTETYVDPNASKRRTTPADFPVTRDVSGYSVGDERESLLVWLRKELKRRRVGSARLMGFMDGNRSDGASYNEFAHGLANVDIDLEREDYMRLFKAVDIGGDRSVSLRELKGTLYGDESKSGPTPVAAPVGLKLFVNEPTTPGFPVAQTRGGDLQTTEEREELLNWLKAELARKRIGASRLLGLMDGDRSASASLNEFTFGLQCVDIALERGEYMRVFKAMDVGGNRSLSKTELEETLYGDGLPEGWRALTPQTRGSFGTCKTCKKENIDLMHSSWKSDNELYTPIRRYFGWCHPCFTTETYVDPNAHWSVSATPGDFPPLRVESGASAVADERRQLLEWLKRELKRRRIGSYRLLGLMDHNRTNSASLNEFTLGLQLVGIGLEREDYMRLFDSVDVGRDRSVSLAELGDALYSAEIPELPRAMTPQTRGSYGSCKTCKRENIDLSHSSWKNSTSEGVDHGLYTPVKRYFGWCGRCFKRETYVDPNAGRHVRCTPEDFPKPRADTGATKADEREQLLAWLREEVTSRQIGATRLMQQMENDRSITASFNEFTYGLQAVDIALERDDYFRLFHAVDADGGRSLSMAEIKRTIYGDKPLEERHVPSPHRVIALAPNEATTPGFPLAQARGNNAAQSVEEREELLSWLKTELARKRIGASRLLGLMGKANRSVSASLNEFTFGLKRVDIDLEPGEYQRLFRAIDVGGDRSVTHTELHVALYSPAGSITTVRRPLTPKTKGSFGTCKMCKKENADLSHNSWEASEQGRQHELYTPVKRYFGWCDTCYKKGTTVEVGSGLKKRCTPENFPGMRTTSGVDVPEERTQLLGWLRTELKQRRVGSYRLLGLMDDNRSASASLNEFIYGLQMVSIDLEHEDYVRLFKAVDVGGDRSVTVVELVRNREMGRRGGGGRRGGD